MHTVTRQFAALALLFGAVLSGCAGSGDTYPSLAIRPFESGNPAPSSAEARPSVPIRPVTAPARLAELRQAAVRAHTAFTAQQGRAAPLARAAAGQPVTSNARAAAVVALADLDSRRAETAATLAALDQLAAEAAGALTADPGLTATQTEVAGLVAEQDAAITALWKTLGS